MKQSDLFFIAGNMYLATSLSGKVAAMYVGLFYAAVMFYYLFKGR